MISLRACARYSLVPRINSVSATTSFKPAQSLRSITTTTKFYKEDKHSLPTFVDPKDTKHEGQFSRTDNTVSIEYPEEHELPRSAPVQGRGSIHFKRTLASFSLEGRSGVVTGGARGLGLVMSQALVISGADVAIVDLNSESKARRLLTQADSQCRGGRPAASGPAHGTLP